MLTTKNPHPFCRPTSNMTQSQRDYREVFDIHLQFLSPIDSPTQIEDSVPSYRGER